MQILMDLVLLNCWTVSEVLDVCENVSDQIHCIWKE